MLAYLTEKKQSFIIYWFPLFREKKKINIAFASKFPKEASSRIGKEVSGPHALLQSGVVLGSMSRRLSHQG